PMAVQASTPPQRNLSWWMGESNRSSLFLLALGAFALGLVVVGSTVVLMLNGLTPVEDLIRGFKSNEFTGVNLFGLIGGVAAMALGWGTYRRMPTKVAREQAVAAAVLGSQAVLFGALALWFSEGNVELFAINYMRFEVLVDAFPAFVKGAKNTLILALSGEFFGIVLGLILAVFAISKRAVVRAPARIFINFFRGTPLAWQLIFIGVAIPIGLQKPIPTYTAAVIALSLNAGAYTAEVFRAGIQSIERGQLEAARGLGLSYMQAMRYAVLPQAIRRVIPPLMNEFVILIKDTSLVILLGLTVNQFDLMSVGNNRLENTFNATYLIGTALGYLAICLPAIRIVNILEKRLRSGLVGVGA
ncbi:MAG: amino acid ABC transporter permease, partial [Actinomycetota bacterium]